MRIHAASYVVLSSLLWAFPGLAPAQVLTGTGQRTFTTDADFAQGTFEGTRAGAPDADQLRIDTGAKVPPYLWIANATLGAVTKIDTRTGRQAARYDSVLTHNWDGSNPAVRPPRDSCNFPVTTAVDVKGNAFVVNRTNCAGSSAAITKYAGTRAECVDRNGNGQIDTSSDLNGDGGISVTDTVEFKGQGDECVLWTKNYAAAGDPGRSLVVDADGNLWAAGFSSSKLYRLDGQTGEVLKVIDLKQETGVASGIQSLAMGPGGVLYTSDNSTQRLVRKIDPNAPEGSHVVATLVSPVPTFGIVVDRDGLVWLGADSDSAVGVVQASFTALTIQLVGGASGCSGRTRGIAVDAAGDIWAACWGTSRLLRVGSNGIAKGVWMVSARPEGVAVAADGRIWLAHSGTDAVAVFNPATNTTQTFPQGGISFTYGDMTGYQHHRFVARQGVWRAVHDSGTAGSNWGTISWNQETQGAMPAGTSIAVSVRAANTLAALPSQPFAQVTNGQTFAGIQGRYIEAKATLRSVYFSGDPVLSDLTIASGNHPPVARCVDQNVCAGPACTAEVSVNNGSYDPDGDAITLAQSPAGPYAIGQRAVSLTVSDGFASESCSGSVQVRDCEPPAITCGADLQAECTGNGAATVSAGGASATDTCSTVSVSGPGLASYPLGTTAVTYTATDAAGNTAACTTQVRVVDTLPPSITCPAPATAECVGGSASNSGVGPASASDVCAPVAVRSPGTASFPLGTVQLTWSAADTSGNTASCSTSFTVADTQAPVVTVSGPASQTLECGSSYMAPQATASDACAGDLSGQVAVSGAAVDPGKPGSYTRTWSVKDPSGHDSASVSRTVTVVDTQAPTLALNGEAHPTLECGSAYLEAGAQASDVCASDLNGAVVIFGTVDTAHPGDYTRTYSVMDPSGNLSLPVTRTVTVADTQAPSLTLNGPATLSLDCAEPYVEARAAAIDSCQGDVSDRVTISGAVPSGKAGTFVLTYGATDSSGNAATPVTRTVTVTDTQGPVISLKGANPLPLECLRDWYSEPGATAMDACSGNLSSAITIEHPPIDSATPGTYAVTYRAADSGGNVSTAVRQVVVQDTLAPELYLNGATSMALECKVDTYSEAGATASDLCSGSLTSAITITGTVNTDAAGAWPVRYRVQDARGLVTEKVRDVKVVDTRRPTLTVSGANAPVMECTREGFVAMGATASDLCAGDITNRITISGTENIVAPGTYPITYNVTDPSGNAAESITRNVTVRDTQAPVVTIIGEANQTLECGVDTYIELGATAYDACQGDMTPNTYGNGANTAAVGTYSIQYGVWDSSGNTTMALRTVKVVDRLPPTLSLVGAAAVQHECASGLYEDPGATASDACYGDLTLSVTRSGSVNAWARGSYPLTYKVQDSTLLAATPLTRTVQVVDTQPPTLEYRDVTVAPADQTLRSFSLADCVTANDMCDGYSLANNGSIQSIYSDEPEDAPGDGDGNTTGDIVITGKSTFKVRAERQAQGDGRVYGVTFELKDQTGNTRTGLCRIRVPAAEGVAVSDNGAGAGYTVVPPPPSTLASRSAR